MGFGSLAAGYVEFSSVGSKSVFGAVDSIMAKMNSLAHSSDAMGPAFGSLAKKVVSNFGDSFIPGISSVISTGIGSAMAGIGTVIAAAIGAVVAAAPAEKMRAEFTQLTGSASKANDIISGLKSTFRGTDIGTEQWSKAARDMAASGLATEEIIKRLKQLGNLSLATGDSLEGMAKAYERAEITGEVSMRTLMAMPPVAEQLAKDFGVTEAALADMASKGQVGLSDLNKALENVAGSNTAIGGMIDAQKNTMIGQWDSLVGNISGIFVELGTQIATAFDVKDILGVLAGVFGLVKDIVSFFGELVPLAEIFGFAMKVVLVPIRWIIDGIRAIINGLKDAVKYAKSFLDPLGLFGWKNTGTAEQKSSGIGEAAGVIGEKKSPFEFMGLTQLAEKMQQEAGKNELAQRQTTAAEKTADNTGTIADGIKGGLGGILGTLFGPGKINIGNFVPSF
jgi:tape measure domain-containing protein